MEFPKIQIRIQHQSTEVENIRQMSTLVWCQKHADDGTGSLEGRFHKRLSRLHGDEGCTHTYASNTSRGRFLNQRETKSITPAAAIEILKYFREVSDTSAARKGDRSFADQRSFSNQCREGCADAKAAK